MQYTTDITSLVSGKVIEVNEALEKSPELVRLTSTVEMSQFFAPYSTRIPSSGDLFHEIM